MDGEFFWNPTHTCVWSRFAQQKRFLDESMAGKSILRNVRASTISNAVFWFRISRTLFTPPLQRLLTLLVAGFRWQINIEAGILSGF